MPLPRAPRYRSEGYPAATPLQNANRARAFFFVRAVSPGVQAGAPILKRHSHGNVRGYLPGRSGRPRAVPLELVVGPEYRWYPAPGSHGRAGQAPGPGNPYGGYAAGGPWWPRRAAPWANSGQHRRRRRGPLATARYVSLPWLVECNGWKVYILSYILSTS